MDSTANNPRTDLKILTSFNLMRIQIRLHNLGTHIRTVQTAEFHEFRPILFREAAMAFRAGVPMVACFVQIWELPRETLKIHMRGQRLEFLRSDVRIYPLTTGIEQAFYGFVNPEKGYLVI
jgi:hypothetical protein